MAIYQIQPVLNAASAPLTKAPTAGLELPAEVTISA
jgi:hypothetical protein